VYNFVAIILVFVLIVPTNSPEMEGYGFSGRPVSNVCAGIGVGVGAGVGKGGGDVGGIGVVGGVGWEGWVGDGMETPMINIMVSETVGTVNFRFILT